MNNGIIFDLDGTLWDASNLTYNSVNQVAKNHNLKEVSMDLIRNVFGLTKEESIKKYFPNVDSKKSMVLGDEISDAIISNSLKFGGILYDGVEETLRNLKNENYSLFIVSNTAKKEYIEAFFNFSNSSEYFTDYLAASLLNITKAEAIDKLISNYNLKNSIYVGDTKTDLEAALNVGIPFVHANYGFGHDLDTTYIIQSIKELPNIIQNIANF